MTPVHDELPQRGGLHMVVEVISGGSASPPRSHSWNVTVMVMFPLTFSQEFMRLWFDSAALSTLEQFEQRRYMILHSYVVASICAVVWLAVSPPLSRPNFDRTTALSQLSIVVQDELPNTGGSAMPLWGCSLPYPSSARSGTNKFLIDSGMYPWCTGSSVPCTWEGRGRRHLHTYPQRYQQACNRQLPTCLGGTSASACTTLSTVWPIQQRPSLPRHFRPEYLNSLEL